MYFYVYEEQKLVQNRISILNEINKIVRSEQELKSKKAVIMLDCGSFQGFQVYQPDIFYVSNIAAYNYPILEKNDGNLSSCNFNEKQVQLSSSSLQNNSNENHQSEEVLIQGKQSENIQEFQNIFENADLLQKNTINKIRRVEQDSPNRQKSIKDMSLHTQQAVIS